MVGFVELVAGLAGGRITEFGRVVEEAFGFVEVGFRQAEVFFVVGADDRTGGGDRRGDDCGAGRRHHGGVGGGDRLLGGADAALGFPGVGPGLLGHLLGAVEGVAVDAAGRSPTSRSASRAG